MSRRVAYDVATAAPKIRARRAATVPRRPPGRAAPDGALRARSPPARRSSSRPPAIGLALAYPARSTGRSWPGLPWLPLLVDALVAAARGARSGWGWLFGTVFFLVLLRWLNFTFMSLQRDPVARDVAADPGPGRRTAGSMSALVRRCRVLGRRALARPGPSRSRRSLWVAGEWVRGHLFGGFPVGAPRLLAVSAPARHPDRRAGRRVRGLVRAGGRQRGRWPAAWCCRGAVPRRALRSPVRCSWATLAFGVLAAERAPRRRTRSRWRSCSPRSSSR